MVSVTSRSAAWTRSRTSRQIACCQSGRPPMYASTRGSVVYAMVGPRYPFEGQPRSRAGTRALAIRAGSVTPSSRRARPADRCRGLGDGGGGRQQEREREHHQAGPDQGAAPDLGAPAQAVVLEADSGKIDAPEKRGPDRGADGQAPSAQQEQQWGEQEHGAEHEPGDAGDDVLAADVVVLRGGEVRL